MTMNGKKMLTCMQAPPDDGVRMLLEGAAGGAPGSQAAVQGVSGLALAHGAGLWAKADVYYFRTVARVQRLWQAGTPMPAFMLEQVKGALQNASTRMSAASCALRSSCPCLCVHEFG